MRQSHIQALNRANRNLSLRKPVWSKNSDDEYNENLQLEKSHSIQKLGKKKLLSIGNALNPIEDAKKVKQQQEKKKKIQKILKKLKKSLWVNDSDSDSGNDERQKMIDQKQQNEKQQKYKKVELLLQSKYIDEAEMILQEELLKEEFIKVQKILETLPKKQRKPTKAQKIRKQDGLDIFMLQHFNSTTMISQSDKRDMFVILLQGVSGAGKSTLINSMINVLFEVKIFDKFRYKIIDDYKKDKLKAITQTVEMYVVDARHKLGKYLTIIDVPGFCDDRGVAKDEKIMQMIERRLNNQIPHINLVLYVFKGNQQKIRLEVLYGMHRVMGIFAKDMIKNFQFVLTFSNFSKQIAIQTLEHQFKSVIKQIGQTWYLKVENSAFFENNENYTTFKQSWKMGQECIIKIFQKMLKNKKVQIAASLNVLNFRNSINLQMTNIKTKITNLQFSQKVIKAQCQIFSKLKLDVLKTQVYKIKIPYQQLIQEKTNKNNTNCTNCKSTCHDDCRISQSKYKYNCLAMDQTGNESQKEKRNCKICLGKCIWSVHVNSNFKYVFVTKEKQETNTELEKQYNVKVKDKNSQLQILVKIGSKYNLLQENIVQQIVRLTDLHRNLQHIGLNEYIKLAENTVTDYIHQMIERQINAKKKGWQSKVQQLRQLEYVYKLKSELLQKGSQQQIKAAVEQSSKKIAQKGLDLLIEDKELLEAIKEKLKQGVYENHIHKIKKSKIKA